jgi:hypothetical protein
MQDGLYQPISSYAKNMKLLYITLIDSLTKENWYGLILFNPNLSGNSPIYGTSINQTVFCGKLHITR